MKKIRIISLLLCIIMLVPLLFSCAKEETEETVTAAPVDTTDGRFDANGYLKDDLPDDLDFNGETLNVYTWTDQLKADWGTREISSNVVEKALYEREVSVCERLNIKLNIVDQKGAWADHHTFIQTLENNNLSGDKTFHMVSQYMPSSGVGALKNLYADLNTISYIEIGRAHV